jgi:hypothetical protein
MASMTRLIRRDFHNPVGFACRKCFAEATALISGSGGNLPLQSVEILARLRWNGFGFDDASVNLKA